MVVYSLCLALGMVLSLLLLLNLVGWYIERFTHAEPNRCGGSVMSCFDRQDWLPTKLAVVKVVGFCCKPLVLLFLSH
jgi:hypothetical protein